MPGLALPVDRILVAADTWAQEHGFENAGKVDMLHAAAMSHVVSEQVGLSPAVVREAICAWAAQVADAGRQAQHRLGTDAPTQASHGQRSLRSHTGASPAALWLDALTQNGAANDASPLIDTLAGRDAKFRQNVQEILGMRVLITERASPNALEELHEAAVKILVRLDILSSGRDDPQVRSEIVRLHRDLLARITKSRGIFLTKVQPGQEVPMQLKHHAAAGQGGADRPQPPTSRRAQALNSAAPLRMQDSLDPSRRQTVGHGVGVGKDAASGDNFIYDFHGRVIQAMGLEELVLRREAQTYDERKKSRLLETHPEVLQELPRVAAAAVDRMKGAVEYVSLLEDQERSLTRVYPTQWHKAPGSILSRRLICDGPFKGIYLDDLVNRLANNDKGYHFDARRGLSTPITPREGEPWISTARVRERGQRVEKLYVRIPFERQYTQLRHAVRELARIDPSVAYQEGSKNCGFYFGPERFRAVRDILKGVVLTDNSRQLLEKHFSGLTEVERAVTDEALEAHRAAAIGGFKRTLESPSGKKRPMDLTHAQRWALARLESMDYSGVLGLDTGMGKTLVAIGMMQELIGRHGESRPFLVVGPPSLRGNFAKEIYKFLEPNDAERLVSRLEVVDYREFAQAHQSGQLNGKKFSPKNFGALIIDEAHNLGSLRAQPTQAALAFDHPRKVVMTASMAKDSLKLDDAYRLYCISKNINLADRQEGHEYRREMRQFIQQSCMVVGGRIVGLQPEIELMPGITHDPKHDFAVWMKQNFIVAVKEMDDDKLPPFKTSSVPMTMPRSMEQEYRSSAKSVAKAFEGMVSLYRDQGVAGERLDARGRKRVVFEPLARHRDIGGVFGTRLRAVVNELNAVTNNSAKIHSAAAKVWDHMETNPRTRAVLFSDSEPYVLQSAQELSKAIPGKIHAACLRHEIRLYKDGKEVRDIGGHRAPFRKQAYRKDMHSPADPLTNRQFADGEWQKFVLDEVIGAQAEVGTCTMFGPVYQEGHNLQWASVGVHLDRDTWSQQSMRQREGRLWRKAQTEPVQFYTFDWVFRRGANELDESLDQIRRHYDALGEDFFRSAFLAPQTAVQLGSEWSAVRQKSDFKFDLDLVLMGTAPTPAQAARLEDT